MKGNIVPWLAAILGKLGRISTLFSDSLVILKAFVQEDEAIFHLRDGLILPRWILDLSKSFLEKINFSLLFKHATPRLSTPWLQVKYGGMQWFSQISSRHCYAVSEVGQIKFWISILWIGLETQKNKDNNCQKKWQWNPQIHHILVSYIQCCSRSWQ